MREVKLPGIGGRLLLHSMPGRRENFDALLQQLVDEGVEVVVSLAPREEIERKSKAYHDAIISGELPVQLLEFPIRDFGVPDDADAFEDLVKAVCDRIQRGASVLVHCGAGIGRTGMFAQCVLLALGFTSEDASRRVGDAGSHPETRGQKRFVEAFLARMARRE